MTKTPAVLEPLQLDNVKGGHASFAATAISLSTAFAAPPPPPPPPPATSISTSISMRA